MRERLQAETRREMRRAKSAAPLPSCADSNACDISTNRIALRAPPFIIILLVFSLLLSYWMTLPRRSSKKIYAGYSSVPQDEAEL